MCVCVGTQIPYEYNIGKILIYNIWKIGFSRVRGFEGSRQRNTQTILTILIIRSPRRFWFTLISILAWSVSYIELFYRKRKVPTGSGDHALDGVHNLKTVLLRSFGHHKVPTSGTAKLNNVQLAMRLRGTLSKRKGEQHACRLRDPMVFWTCMPVLHLCTRQLNATHALLQFMPELSASLCLHSVKSAFSSERRLSTCTPEPQTGHEPIEIDNDEPRR